MALLLKQRLFVGYYLGKAKGNASQAARLAGFKSPRVLGPRLLSKVAIADAIAEKMAAVAMEADEVLARLSRQASSDMGDFLGHAEDPTEPPPFDFGKARKRDQLGNIRKIKRTTRTIPRGRDMPPEEVVEVELQVYDPRPALETLAKFHRLIVGDSRPPDGEKPKRIIIAGSTGADERPG